MLHQRLLALPRFVALGIYLDRTPPLFWLGLLAATLLPTWTWMGRRLLDGSDDPLGIVALAALLAVGWCWRASLRSTPRLGWLALALAGAVLSTAALGRCPPLVAALPGLLAMGAALAAFLPSRVASTPVLGLSVLSLPLLASLQFYAGYPLRLVTAEASRWLLAPFFIAERTGASLRVDGRLVIVDAPCSGVQMLWLGEFTACVVALWTGRRDASFLARLPAVSALVLAGNVVRNTVLVAFEAGGRPLPRGGHEAVGLLVLALVCAAIAWVMHAPREARDA
ncbi:MAG TPA: exosortase Q [Ramlibacter sp.]|jgi:exosortase/archaeosortase family protein|uniref:exosortase Q n=1 Tax=Ramlibacter sp. TaxID=1917967 RepID=UPI002D5D8D0F|nr:exosortase Q [Ramlibacter sp.]HZY18801.1 exosortase Q [Ramlibacter sp.]